ncbi:hypothetical protein AXG93_3053s1050 [Marchantia polymorpha subsp. ruderalis]|uniref:Uncharacterized protein n=1 Tax=Marchantia polymorpha subsp. ruderalis TaxID=1480154 RepID=A0A176WS61_MARPO|nr:hypothetical protein AXG93_3053s1050 [Marchantia polymorpha subsp. ruderalis]
MHGHASKALHDVTTGIEDSSQRALAAAHAPSFKKPPRPANVGLPGLTDIHTPKSRSGISLTGDRPRSPSLQAWAGPTEAHGHRSLDVCGLWTTVSPKGITARAPACRRGRRKAGGGKGDAIQGAYRQQQFERRRIKRVSERTGRSEGHSEGAGERIAAEAILALRCVRGEERGGERGASSAVAMERGITTISLTWAGGAGRSLVARGGF